MLVSDKAMIKYFEPKGMKEVLQVFVSILFVYQ